VLRIANDALRFRPKTETAGSRSEASARSERMITRLKDELQLTTVQSDAVRAAMAKLAEEMRSQTTGVMAGGQLDVAAMRQRTMARVEQVLAGMLTDAQRPLFEKWKQGRDSVRSGTVYVLEDGAPSRRFVRTGVSDDQFTEVVTGEVAEGDPAILRAREAKP
jgi:HlyD family secretion protein